VTPEIAHGTDNAAYQRCRRANGLACTPCREAHREWMRHYRHNHQPAESKERQRQWVRARGRALQRLADMHPGQFKALLEEERTR
jgi:hypothetical protein